MKEQYDKTAAPVPFEIGSKVWVYTPKSRKGLSKKLAHNFHGPYRIVSKLSPVHFKLRTMDNRPVSVPVHANRMKAYYDPSDRSIAAPSFEETSPDLADTDLPPDSFQTTNTDRPSLPTPVDNALNRLDEEPAVTRPEDTFTPAEIVAV